MLISTNQTVSTQPSEDALESFILPIPWMLMAKSRRKLTKRAVEGTLGILRACLNSKRSVKRVIYISSAATILYNNKGLNVTDESTWSDLDICRSSKLVNPSYLLSKTITERTALEFAAKNGLDLITLVLPLVVGSFICPTTPSSVSLALAMILGLFHFSFHTFFQFHLSSLRC